MCRHTLAQVGLLLLACALSSVLSFVGLGTISFWCFYFIAISSGLLLDPPLALGGIILNVVCSGLFLYFLPPSHRGIPLRTLLIAEAFVCGTALLVLVLTVRLRRQVHAAARAAENILPRADRPAPAHLYARLVDLAPYGVTVVDSGGYIVFWNQKAQEMFGYTRDEALGQTVEMLVPTEHIAQHRGERAAYMTQPRIRAMADGQDLKARRKDGSVFSCEISLAPIQTVQGGIETILVKASINDITQRKEQEQALIAAQVQQKAAEEAVRERDQLLAIAAHELKTPITSIAGFSELVTRTLAEAPMPLPAPQRDRLQTALAFLSSQTARLARLIEQLLDVSRLHSNRFTLYRDTVNLVALCHEQVVLAQATTHEHHIVLDAPEETIDAWIDPLRIGQVLTNLLGNSIKYAPGGIIIVSVRKNTDDSATLRISDEGPGVTPEKRVWLFTRFAQAHDNGTGQVQQGLGLGLWLSREIIYLHNGDIWADFPDDGGMVVTVTLPTATPRGATAAHSVLQNGPFYPTGG